VSTPEAHDITLSLTTLDQLFNAPPVDPFSDSAIEARGESGVSYLLHQLQPPRRDWADTRMIVRLPADQITPDLSSRLSAAIHRYCQARIDDNAQDIHAIRVRSSTGLGIFGAIVIVIVAAAYYVFTQVIPNAPESVQAIVGATICVFAWVVLWDSLEALLFNPIPAARENRQLRRLMQLPITVEPYASTSGAPDEQESTPDRRTAVSGA
jgi:hypothetical protein